MISTEYKEDSIDNATGTEYCIYWGDDYMESSRNIGPSVIWDDGTIMFESKDEPGMLHRSKGPASIYKNGSISYYTKGGSVPHRLDGPAFVFSNGTKSYAIDGKTLELLEFLIVSAEYRENT